MLARITDLAADATTDRAGTRLRFTDRGQLAYLRSRLTELGYENAELAGAEYDAALAAEWYEPADLSREEARVLASQIVPVFIAEHALASAPAEALRKLVESALFDCFTANPIGSAASSEFLQKRYADAVAAATYDLLGSAASEALGEFVDRWLSRA